MMLKMAVLMPIPRPRQRMPTIVKPRLCQRLRTAYRISRSSIDDATLPRVADRSEHLADARQQLLCREGFRQERVATGGDPASQQFLLHVA